MQTIKQILLVFIFILMSKNIFSQTAGINYQALISNSEEIQIPGADVELNQVVLGSENVSFRFTISDETFQELYSEEQITITDENGMVSLIVGDGDPIFSTFEAIVWDGTLKYLNVEIDIHSQNQGYVFLDIQKILYLPQSGNGATIDMADTQNNLPVNDNSEGDLIWVRDADSQGNPSLMVWDGMVWQMVNKDFDPKNELRLIVVTDDNDRDLQFTSPNTGDQVWNQDCECIQIFDGALWKVFNGSIVAGNGLYIDSEGVVKLGGTLNESTQILTNATNTLAITGLQEITPTTNNNVLTVDTNSGVITRTSLESLFR